VAREPSLEGQLHPNVKHIDEKDLRAYWKCGSLSVRVGNPVLCVTSETFWSDLQVFEGKGSSGCTSHNMAHFKAKIEEDIRKNIRSKNTKQQTNGYNSPKSLICQANKNPVQAGT
jgi:inner membrane protein involved in colicin E2 resistance